MEKKVYTAKDIEVRELVEHIRLRPAMYVGSVDQKGLQFLLDSIRDEFLEAGSIVKIVDYEIEIQGQPLSVEMHPKANKTILELLFTTLGTGKGPPGSWVFPILNALSENLRVETTHQDKTYQLSFSRGKLLEPMKITPAMVDSPAIHVSFVPDPAIWKL